MLGFACSNDGKGDIPLVGWDMLAFGDSPVSGLELVAMFRVGFVCCLNCVRGDEDILAKRFCGQLLGISLT